MSEETSSRPEKKPARSATAYLIILFLSALLLLVLSFFMQQRQELMDLNDTSVAASRDINELRLANQQLELQLQESRRAREAVQKDLEAAEARAAEAQKEAEALEWLRQIQAASYPKAKELAEAFEQTDLKEYLPEESVVEGGTSPAETYQNLYDKLFD